MAELTIIVAATLTNGIGLAGRLPWRLPLEMAYFARVTSNALEGRMNAVIMGRKSWESIPEKFKPLGGRLNVVISAREGYDFGLELPPPNTQHASSLPSALSLLSQKRKNASLHRTFIIGGSRIYHESLHLPNLRRILLTRIHSPRYECDVFFPKFQDKDDWERASHRELEEFVGFDVAEGMQDEKGTEYEFQMWIKK